LAAAGAAASSAAALKHYVNIGNLGRPAPCTWALLDVRRLKKVEEG
jgi:hypothetical protein